MHGGKRSQGCDVEGMRGPIGYSLEAGGCMNDPTHLSPSGSRFGAVYKRLVSHPSEASWVHERPVSCPLEVGWVRVHERPVGCPLEAGWVHERPIGHSLDANGHWDVTLVRTLERIAHKLEINNKQ